MLVVFWSKSSSFIRTRVYNGWQANAILPLAFIYWSNNKLAMNIIQCIDAFFCWSTFLHYLTDALKCFSFFINPPHNFIFPLCEDKFIKAMFFSSFVSTISDILHHARFSFFRLNVIAVFVFRTFGEQLPQFMTSYYLLTIFVCKIRALQMRGNIELSLGKALAFRFWIYLLKLNISDLLGLLSEQATVG